MDDFIKRQLAQIRFQISDFRQEKISLNTFLVRIESIARAIDEKLWTDKIYPIALGLEQINADLVEERRKPMPPEDKQVENLLASLELLVTEIEKN